MHTQLPVPAFRTHGQLGFAIAAALCLWAQPPAKRPPEPPPPPAAPRRIEDIRRKLHTTEAVNVTARRALAYGRVFLADAEKALHSNQTFKADRLAAGADALVHVAEHQEHLRDAGGPRGPPPRLALSDHLQRVYFRTRQADYLFELAKDPRAASFPKWARDFYQLAVRAYERDDLVAADESAKCADEIVKCLEDLAQASTTVPPLPVPPRKGAAR